MLPSPVRTALEEFLAVAQKEHEVLSEKLRVENMAVMWKNPTPPPAARGRSTLQLITDARKTQALRVLIASVALKGPDATFGEIKLKDCFDRRSQAVACAHGLRLTDVFPKMIDPDAHALERSLESTALHFKGRRIRALKSA